MLGAFSMGFPDFGWLVWFYSSTVVLPFYFIRVGAFGWVTSEEKRKGFGRPYWFFVVLLILNWLGGERSGGRTNRVYLKIRKLKNGEIRNSGKALWSGRFSILLRFLKKSKTVTKNVTIPEKKVKS